MNRDRLRPWQLARDTPGLVWLLCGLQFLLAAGYAFAVPLLHAPDEHSHVDRVLSPGEPADLDPLEDDELSRRTVAILPRVDLAAIDWRVAPYQPWEGLAAEEALPRDARPAYEDLAPDEDSGIFNQVASHPPAYYVYASGTYRAARWLDGTVAGGGSWSWDVTVLVLRMLSALLILPLPWLVYWTVERLSGRGDVATVAATLPLGIPQLAHIAGSVNNDVLLLVAASTATMGTVWIATGDRSWGTAVLTGTAAGVALLTKIFALAAPLWIVAAYAVGWLRSRRGARDERSRRHGREVVRALAIAAVATVAAGGWFVIRAVVRYGTPAPRGAGYPGAEIEPDLAYWLGQLWWRTTRSFWGFFGVEQFAIPTWLAVALTVVGIAAIASAFSRGTWERPAVWRAADLAVLLLPASTALMMMLYAAWGGYLASGLPVGIHGRYLFVGVCGLAVTVALGFAPHAPRRMLLPGTTAACLAVQVVGAWTVTRSFWAGQGPVGELRAMLAWAPIRGRYVLLLFALLVLLAGVVMWRSVVAGRFTPSPAGEDAGTP